VTHFKTQFLSEHPNTLTVELNHQTSEFTHLSNHHQLRKCVVYSSPKKLCQQTISEVQCLTLCSEVGYNLRVADSLINIRC